MKRLCLMLLTVFIFIYVFLNITESFLFEEDMLVIKNLDNKLIKKYKIMSNLTIYEDEINKIFKNNKIARFYVPNNYYLTVKYNSKIILLQQGQHDLKYVDNDKTITQIEIRTQNLNDNIFVNDRVGNVIFRPNLFERINWDYIYDDFRLDNYYVVYPWGRRLYNYNNYPNYRRRNKYPIRHNTNLKLRRK